MKRTSNGLVKEAGGACAEGALDSAAKDASTAPPAKTPTLEAGNASAAAGGRVQTASSLRTSRLAAAAEAVEGSASSQGAPNSFLSAAASASASASPSPPPASGASASSRQGGAVSPLDESSNFEGSVSSAPSGVPASSSASRSKASLFPPKGCGGKQLNFARVTDSYAILFPNALPLKTVVWAKEAVSQLWRPCVVVYARPSPERRAAAAAAEAAAASAAASRLFPLRPQHSSHGGHLPGKSSNFNRALFSQQYSSNAPWVPQQSAPSFVGCVSAARVSAEGGAAGESQTQSSSLGGKAKRSSEDAGLPTGAVSASGSAGVSSFGSVTQNSALVDVSLLPKDYDYYVHFVGLDRRLDAWVEWEKIREDREALPEGEATAEAPPEELDEEHAGIDQEYLREHEEATRVKTVGKICIGSHLVDSWYFSPYPLHVQNTETLFLCEFCLAFFKHEGELQRHALFCECRHPPGNEIYRDGKVSVFEVDGSRCRVYCENLCFLSKLFLDHKTLKHPVSLFVFYVLTEHDSRGHHITGYFSKEKHSKNNLSCLLTLPHHQRKGYGKFLIAFSYTLSKKEKRTGGPERPLSDLGLSTYLSVWGETILDCLCRHPRRKVSLQELSEETAVDLPDILTCLEHLGVIRYVGESCFLLLPEGRVKEIRKAIGRPAPHIDSGNLHWVSYDGFLPPADSAGA